VKEVEAGLHAITDGEFPRSFWHIDWIVGLKGAKYIVPEHGYVVRYKYIIFKNFY
jgi:methionine synthase II (cobalamin-independent)